MDDLDMSASVVVAFPLARRAALVRHVANTLAVINAKRADAYWHKTRARLRRELLASGLCEASADREVRSLWWAVEDAIRGWAITPDEAA